MVRLKCLKCGKTWREIKKQEASEEVHCPKCGELNHTHSKPINPPKPTKVRKKKKEEAPIPQPINPYEYKTWHQRDIFDERTVGFTPDKVNRKKIRKVEK